MSTKHAAELKAGAPHDFDGDSSDALRWLLSVKAFFLINPDIYDTDLKKVGVALAYMTKGTAATWAQNYYTDSFEKSAPSFGTFAEYEKSFRASFLSVDTKQNAITDLSDIKQGHSLTDYIARFKTLVSQSTLKQNASLIHFFEKGLKEGLRKQVYLMETLPTTIDKWYEAVTRLNNNYQRGLTFNRNPKPQKPTGGRFVPKPSSHRRDPDAMDVDRTLTQKERSAYMKEGKCFACGETGHRANDRSFHPKVRQGATEDHKKKGKKSVRRGKNHPKDEDTDDEESDEEDSDDEDMEVNRLSVKQMKGSKAGPKDF